MTDRPQDNASQERSVKPRFRGETVERRLLLSATWIDGTTGDDLLLGTAGDDLLRGLGGTDTLLGLDGDDLLQGGAGIDLLDGGAGFDTVDYSLAAAGVQVDLTAAAPQDTGGGGVDTLVDVEGVIGSDYGDTFAFSAPVDGAVYSVDGGAGYDTIDLTGFASSAVTFGDGTITVDMGGGQSFTIDYADIGTISFSDLDATVLAGPVSEPAYSGSGLFIDGDQAFRIDVNGAGTIAWEYDPSKDELDILDVNGTDPATAISVTDLNGHDLVIDEISIDGNFGSLTTNVGVQSIVLDSVAVLNLRGDIAIGGNLGSFEANGIDASVTIDGDLGRMDVDNDIKDAGVITVSGSAGTIDIGGVIKDGSTVTIGGDAGTVTVGGDIRTGSSISIGGDAGQVIVNGSVDGASDVTIGAVVGDLDFKVGGVQYGGTFGSPTWISFSGGATVTDRAPIADAGPDQAVVETSLVGLDASGSLDPEGQPIGWTWSQVGGPAVVLSDVNAAQPTFAAPAVTGPTVLTFEVTVNDGRTSMTDIVAVTVNPQGLVANWTFDDSGQVVRDVTGFGADGTLGGSSAAEAADPTRLLDPGRGYVLGFDGTDYVAGTGSSPSGAFSVSSWAKTDGASAEPWQTIFSAGDNEIWLGISDTGKVALHVGGTSNWVETSAGVVSSDVWNHIAGTWDGTTARIFVNGGEVLTTTFGTLADPTAATTSLGIWSGDLATRGWSGALDDIRIYDTALGSGAVATIAGVPADIPPTASAGPDQTVDERDLVTLDGTKSFDPDGKGLAYTWVQTGGPAVTLSDPAAAQPTFVAPEGLANTAVSFELTVFDGVNVSCVDSVTVNVNASNDAPTAKAGPDQVVNEVDVVTLDGSGSVDPEAQGLTYSWVQTSGPTVVLSDPTAAQPTFTAPDSVSNTSVSFELTVSDGVNSSSVDTVTIQIAADDDAPAASAGADQAVGGEVLVTLDGTGSVDPEAQGLTYTWVQTKGPPVALSDVNAAQPTFTAPDEVADLEFELTVSDGVNKSVDTVAVVVTPVNEAPVVTAGPAQRVDAGTQVVLTAEAEDPNRGDTLTYAWTQVSGPRVALFGGDTASPTFTAPTTDGGVTLTFRVVVSDGELSAVDTVTVTVDSKPEAPPPSDPPADTADGAGQPSDATGGGTVIPIGNQTSVNEDKTESAGRDSGDPDWNAQDRSGDDANRTLDPDTDPGDSDKLRIDAGENRIVSAGSLVRLRADVSGDGGSVPSARWTQISGTPITLEGAGTLSPSFVAPAGQAADDLVFRLEVSIGGVAHSDIVTITVLPRGADAAPETVLVAEGGDTVRLDPLETSVPVPDGTDLVYSWTQIGGTTVQLPDANAASQVIELPEVFVQEELVFEVRITAGGVLTTQQLTVRVEPVDDVSRPTESRAGLAGVAARTPEDAPEESGRGVGRIWAALLAFFQTRRRNED